MNILNITSLDDLKKNSNIIKSLVSQNGSVLIRGLFDNKTIRNVIPKIFSSLDSSKLIGTTCGDSNLPRRNSFKWSVGGYTGAQIGNARLMIIAYNPLNAPDVFDFHNQFQRLIAIRDVIGGDGNSTNDDNLNGNSFNACRFQIYPSGGGFMLGHKDYIAEETSLYNGAPLLQLLLFVTERGKDFSEGGAYIINSGNELDIESYAQSGDIAIYNGQSFHGVKDIDPFMPLCTQKIRGRVVALVTIYK